MAIHLYRSNRTEKLVEALCKVLQANAPSDPFLEYPIVVGSRGMERWLKHEIATLTGVSARLAFPFPRPAFEGAARWLLRGGRDDAHPFWEGEDPTADRLNTDRLTFRVVDAIRERRAEPAFADVAKYLELGDNPEAVSSRELVFADKVALVLSALLVDRGEQSLAWAKEPQSVDGKNRWLAYLLHDLEVNTLENVPHRLLLTMQATPPAAAGRSFCVFGLSSFSPGERAMLQAVSTFMDVHLFVIAPTQRWIGDDPSKPEVKKSMQSEPSKEKRDAVEEALELANPILYNLGTPSKELQKWLEDVQYQESDEDLFEVSTDDGELRELQVVQNWILNSEAEPDATPTASNDGSLEFHRAYGAMRQCEVLREKLLDAFANDPSLEPRDVLVMTPDITTYAPLVSAVFSRRPQSDEADKTRLPEIPVAVADLGLRETNPVAAALLSLVALAGERFKASWLVDFMALDPVRRRFGFDEDLPEVQSLLQASGFRWGEDAQDRARVEQPELDQNTARFAMERMSLGVLMPDEDLTRPTVDAAGGFGPATAMDIRGGERTRLVGQLNVLLRAVMRHRAALREPANPATWRERFVAALDDLTQPSDKAFWLRVEVNGVLEELVSLTNSLEGKPSEGSFTRQAMESWLEGRFELKRRGDRPITGAVQVCAMEPMRSVPFKVVALLGMDDGIFPSITRRPTWDPMGQKPIVGDRDRREVDRHLLLEAILSARETLMVFWTGFDVQKGDKQPAAVPIEELMESLNKVGLEVNLTSHALQPWNSVYFQGDEASFDHGLLRAAVQLQAQRREGTDPTPVGLMASTDKPLPAPTVETDRLELEVLAKWLVEPQKQLLKERLRINFYNDDVAVADRSVSELNGLERWSLTDRLLEARMAGDDERSEEARNEGVKARLRGEGNLPLGVGADRALATAEETAEAVLRNLETVKCPLGDGVDLSLKVDDDLHLIGRVERVRQHEGRQLFEWFTASKAPNEKLKLKAWVHLLVAAAMGLPVEGARLVGATENKKVEVAGVFLAAPRQPVAAAHLKDLFEVYREAQSKPIELFRRTSSGLAEAWFKHRDKPDDPKTGEALLKAFQDNWNGGKYRSGDSEEKEVSAFFEDYVPQLGDHKSPIRILMEKVWLPVVIAAKPGVGDNNLAERWQLGGAEG